MIGTDGIHERALYMRAGFFSCFHGALEVAHIIKRIKNADDANAIIDRTMHKLTNHIVGVMVVAKNVLAAQ